LGAGALQLGATYSSGGAQLAGPGFDLRVGIGSFGRPGIMRAFVGTFARLPDAATYDQASITDSFRTTEQGIEQTFHVAKLVSGRGALVIDVPVSGLRAVSDGVSIDLQNAGRQIRATYSGLSVTDAAGHVVPAGMRAVDHGNAIAIEVHDAGARYPLTVDPTWSQTAELIVPGSSDLGQSVAISGTTAVVSGNGTAYVFSLSGTTWAEAAELPGPAGAVSDGFGYSVGLSGTTAIVGAPDQTADGNYEGAAYVFSLSAGTWAQVTELTVPDPYDYNDFGQSVAISGTTAIVGAPLETVDGDAEQGAAYVFGLSGGTWAQVAELAASDGGYENYFGSSVAISGSTAIVGAPMVGAPFGSGGQGAAYVFSLSGGTWAQTVEFNPSAGAVNDWFGSSVAISGTTAIVGAAYPDGQGAAYVFSLSGGTWAQDAELAAPGGGDEDYFGSSVAISGTTAIVQAFNESAVYVFSLSGGTWAQAAEVPDPDTGGLGDWFDTSVAISGTTAIFGAAGQTVDGKVQGAAYIVLSDLVEPQGTEPGPDGTMTSAPVNDYRSPSEPAHQCPCEDPVYPATGDLVETATDLSLPGAGVPLSFTRTYDAQVAQSEAAAATPAPSLGYGWADNFAMSLAYSSLTGTATVTEENGAQIAFTPYVLGTSPAWCTSAANFCSTAPRVEATLNQNSGGTWTFVRYVGSQTTFTFSSAGDLTEIADAEGDTLSSSAYSPVSGQAACPSGDTCTVWTSSASGRELVLAVNSSGQLTSVFDANSTLAVSFAYSGTGCSTWSDSEVPDLCTATDPGDLVSSYSYDSGNSTTSFDYDLLTETPLGVSAATTNVYNSSGLVTQQTDPSGAVTTFAYAGTNSTLAGGTTTVTDYPLGTGTGEPEDQTVYEYSNNVLIAETTGAGASSASTEALNVDPVSLLPLSAVDGDTNISTATFQTYSGTGGTPTSSDDVLTSTDAVGNTTEYAYNSDNQAWCTVAPAEYANGVSCPLTAPTSPPAPGASDSYLGVALSFYNSSDQLTTVTDALGNTTTYSYTSAVSGVPNGLEYCSLDPVDYQADVTCPAYGAAHVSGTTSSTYDSAGDLTSSTDADGDTTSYVYDATGHPGLVSSETDPDGTTTSYIYNGAGEVTSAVVSFGSYSATTQYAYDSYGRQFCTVAPYEYAKGVTCPSSPPSPPTPSSDPYLGATITTYDADGRVVQVTNPLGGITYNAYDEAGELFCTVAPAEAALGVTCPSTAPSTAPTIGDDPYLGSTITTYDANGRPVQVTGPLGGITLTAYDTASNVLQTTVESNNATTDPNVVTSYSYDADNRVVSTTVDPGGGSLAATTLQVYDPDGNVYCSVSANAVTSGGYQCPPWQAGWVSNPPSPSSLYSSTPTSAQADNVTTTFYDANGDQLQSTDPDVHTSITVFDGDARTYCSADPTNVSTWMTAHPSGTYPYLCPTTPPSSAPAQGSNPGYLTTIFDPAGRVLSSTDQVGDSTSYAYAPAGQVLTTTNPRGYVTTDCYYYEDTTGECAYGAPAGGGSADDRYSTTTLSTASDPSGEMTDYTYYAGDEPDTTTTPAGTTADDYDASGDLTSVDYSSTASGYSAPANVSYTYNVDGTRNTMTDATGTTSYGYDGAGDVTSQILTATATDLSNATTSYGYFSTGAVASVAYPAYSGSSDPEVNYTYDATGAMASETDWEGDEVTFAHDGDGNETAQDNNVNGTYPDGTSSTTWSYDAADNAAGGASSYACTGGTETLSQSFSGSGGSINPDGQLTQYSTSYSGSCTAGTAYQRDYSYDLAGRVVYQGASSQGSNPNNFAYDPAGDPTTISSHDSSGNFDTYTGSYDNDGELTNQGPVSGSNGTTSGYTYDTLGDQTNAVSSTATNYSFNQAAQMTGVLTAAGSTATYLYNGYGLEAAATTTLGTTPKWSAPSTVDSTRSVKSVSCPSASFCAAVDTSGYATIYNGTSWSTPSDIDGSHALESVSCTSSTFCKAVDNDGNVLSYTGTWSSASSIDSTRVIDSVTCTTSSFCAAVDASGYATTYNGTSWATATDVDGSHALESVSCTSSTSCLATDNDGGVISYNGTAWSAALDIDSTRVIDGVSCPTVNFCAGVDTSGYGLIYEPTPDTWSAPSTVDSTRSVKSVSCPSASFCAAVDTSGYATIYNGTSWSTPSDIDGSHALESVSCTSSTFCKAVDNDGNVLSYTGTWSSASSIDSTRVIDSVSCTSTSFCAAVDASGYATTYNGTSWATAADKDGSHAIESVSCTSSSFCKAVDNDGNVLSYTGTWSSASSIDSTRVIDSVTCTTSSFCAAVDASGYATTYNGTSWATATDVDGSHALESVSCTSSTSCLATDNDGGVISYNGTAWSAALDIDSTRVIDGVSCPTVNFCAGVDTSGYGLIYEPTTSSSEFTWDTNGGLALGLSDGNVDYIYGPGSTPVEQVSLVSSTPTYLTYTAANSTWLSTNTAGDKTGFWGYDAFGNLAFGTPTSAFGYAGQYSDATTGLSDMRARWYDAETGEFTTVDPDVTETGQPYAYAGDDPVNEDDPSGLHKCNGDPLTWGGCVVNVVDKAIPPLIESVSWAPYSSKPCDANGWILTVNPSAFGRATYALLTLSSNLLLDEAWSETLELAKKVAPKSPPGADADTSSMHDQFACHWVFVRELPFRAFHLQTWLSDPGFVGEVRYRCNPAPMAGWSPNG
jgi:RHS repeat-associated protein